MKFIKLTDVSSKYNIDKQQIEELYTVMFVNPYYIGSFMGYKGLKNTYISFRNNSNREVKESPEEIIRLINEENQ